MMRWILVLCLGLAGCGTMGGLGDDMQQAGASLSDKASRESAPRYSDAPRYQEPPPSRYGY